MNKSKKGTRIEKLLDDKLKALGFVTHRARKNVIMTKGRVFAQRNDIWGCFDVMAKHPLDRDLTFYFQCSTDWKRGEARKELESFPAGLLDGLFMVRKENRKDFEFRKYEPEENEWIPIDIRKITPE